MSRKSDRVFTKSELDAQMRAFEEALVRGAPHTYRSPNMAHRKMLALEAQGRVKRARVERMRIWWTVP